VEGQQRDIPGEAGRAGVKVILVVDMNWLNDSLASYEFVSPIVLVAKEYGECKVKHYMEVTREDLDAASNIVLSGTPLKDNVTLQQPAKFSWLKDTNKPVLGVCAGMQTLGVVFGQKLTRCLQIGMTQICTIRENPLFSGMFKAYTLHNFSVETSSDFEVLAESAHCIQAVKHKQKQVYGVLFHPEVRNPEVLKRFFELKQ
jgi:GMP synthase-like glutamine amidotransferase